MPILTRLGNLETLVGWIVFPLFCIFFKIQTSGIANVLGFIYPAYWTISAIESSNKKYRKVLLLYWLIFCSSSFIENFSFIILRFIPAYYKIKIGILLWIILIPKPSQVQSNKKVNSLNIKRIKEKSKKETKSCIICLEEVPLNLGYVCTGTSIEHNCNIFTCWTCIESTYKAANKPDAIMNRITNEGVLVCPNPKCDCAITMLKLLPFSPPPQIIHALQDLQIKTQKEQAVQAATAQERALIHAEYMRIEQIKDQDEKTAAKLHRRIVEEVLTLKCPRCFQAFQDFEGCFALTCGNKHCKAGFCAWCLTDCGRDAHAHVLTCIENPKQQQYHNSFEIFEIHHKKRKILKMKEIIALSQLTLSANAKLCDKLVHDLRDLGISIEEIFPDVVPIQADDAVEVRNNLPHDDYMGFNIEDYVENWED